MTPERWSQIEKLYHEAQERSLADRAVFLDEVCRADHELRRQIESLLKFDQKLAGFIEVPALEVAAKQLSTPADRTVDVSLTGQTIGHYLVLEQLGSGGMGVVYKARDQDLDRFVALKILQPGFALDSKRFSLLKQEARSASALNHPNVVTIYEVGQTGSTPYIAMEWVDGKTLRQRLSSGPLPFENILQIADQLANALSKMHAAGLVHRDLKPENVMITDDALAKILDFGLAKIAPEDPGPTPVRFGVEDSYRSYLVGTVAYMAPERILGHADAKSDQFSLGCILYEMAAGQPAFRRDTVNETLSAIRHDEVVPLNTVRKDTPAAFCRMVERCLAKDPNDRYAASEELLQQLRSIRDVQSGSGILSQRARLVAASALVLLVSVAGLNVTKIRDRLWESSSRQVRSLAVLPLESLGPAATDEYFLDGMTEELITEIGQTMSQQLKVISRDTVMHYKQTHKSVQEIADELKVDAVLEGSVLMSPERIRITEKLVRATTQEVLWTNSYEGSTEDVLRMQQQTARDIAREINVKLTPEKQTDLTRASKIDAKAHQDFLAGLYHFNDRFHSGAEGLEKSVQFFNQAIESEPNYAPAYAALANSYLAMGFFGIFSPPDAYKAANENALKSLNLDPNNAEAHAALGRIRTSYEWNWAGAETEFKRAIELNSNYSLAYQWYAILLVITGRADEGLAMTQQALDNDELSLSFTSGRAWLSYLARRYDESVQKYRRALEIDPVSLQEIEGLAEAYEMAGSVQEAFDTYQQWARTGGMSASQITSLERAYKKGGIKGYWQRRLEMEIEDEKGGDVWTYVMASLYARVGNKEQALGWLEKAYGEHHDRLILLNVDPVFDSLRSDPRFVDVVKRVGLPL